MPEPSASLSAMLLTQDTFDKARVRALCIQVTAGIVFNSALNARKNVDTITDFGHKYDTFELDDAFCKGLKAGKLGSDAFHVGTNAADKEDRIVYDEKSGDVYFDRDGAVDKYDAVKFAVVADNTKLDHTDFLAV